MKRKSLLFALLVALFMPWAANAQTVTIGTGTSAHNSAPIANYYNYSLAEMLFTADEIGTTDVNTILSLGFEGAAASSKTYGITVYMKNVDATSFSANTDYIQVSADDVVYTGSIKPEAGWNTIDLPSPFAYDNTQSLLVVVHKSSGGYDGNTSIWKYTSMSSPYMMLYAQADGTTYNPTTLTSLATNAERPNVQLTFGTPPSCVAPTSVTATADGNVTWEGEGTTWNLNYKASSASTWTEVNGLTSMSYTIPNLAGLTTYSVRVQNVCDDNSTTGWTYANDFTTPASIPFVETFNTSSAPSGWTKYSGLLSGVMDGTVTLGTTTSGWQFGTNNNVFDSHARVNIYGTSCKYWLVTPALTMENNVQLSFDLAYTAYSGSGAPAQTGTDDKFVVLITTDGGTTWTILRQWDNAGSEFVLNNLNPTPTTVIYDLSSYAGQNIAVAFYAESTESNADNNLHIDNVSIDYIPACAKPTGLGTSNVTAHEATISWTSDAEAWQVMLNEDEENIIDVEENTYTFTLLDPETTYTAKVRTNCDGIYSEWTNPVNFTTTVACPAPTTLVVTSNALTATFTWQSDASQWEVVYATDATANPDECTSTTVNEATYTVNDLELGDYYFWVRANCGDLDGYSTWVGPSSVHIGYCVPNPSSRDGKGITKVNFGIGDYMVNNVNETNGLPATSPYYGDYTSMVGAMQAGVESTISITYATGSSTVYSYGTIIWVDWDNSLSFEDSEIVYTGTSAQGSGGVPQVLEASFIVPADQAIGEYRMRIAGADSYFDSYISGTATGNHSACFSSSYAVCHDYTLRVLEAPSCMMPTNVAINYTGGTTAEVTWEGTAETYNIDMNGTVINNVTTPYTIEGLELATTYAVMVQANCEGDETSEWTAPVSFTTDLCMPEDQCEITFELTDSYGDGWNGGAGIRVIDVETNAEIGFMTNENLDGESGYGNSELNTLTLAVCDGREIQFVWVSGSFDSECSYVVKDANGVEIFSGEGAMTESVNYTVNCSAANTYPKDIVGYGEGEGNWYLIASPVVDVNPSEVDGMITDAFDLYYFDEAGDEDGKEWINYNPDGFNLESGKGYLYASQGTTTLTFTGTLVAGTTYEVLLAKTEGAEWSGWNLVGNPFTVTAYIANREFYTMNDTRTELMPVTGNSIEAMEGIFVVATENNESLSFTTIEPEENDKSMLVVNLSQGNGVMDRAIVRFDEGSTLPKFQLRKNSTKVYIPMDNQDYAVVRSEELGEMPVSFKAEENGSYTLSFNTENVEFGYLHLIDNMTGNDVDLLSTPSYSFEAKTTDYANRFKLVFATGSSSDSDTFAFYSNGSFVINNEGMATVQVIDINGRILSSESINGCANINVNAATGVYMLRLVNGENVKVQKVVVR